MPTYVYKFEKTGETIEVQQSFAEDTLTKYKHPETGRMMTVKKIFQPVGVTFKGSGFFKNDNRDKKSTTMTPGGSESSGSESSGSESSGSESSGSGSSGDGGSSDAGGEKSSSTETKSADTNKTDTNKTEKSASKKSTASAWSSSD